MFQHNIQQRLVNVLIEHHPTIGDISSPTDICFGDVKQIPKKGHQSQPLYSTMTLVPSRGSKPICLSKIQLSETAIDFDQTESRQTKRKDFTYENSQVLNITAYAKPIH